LDAISSQQMVLGPLGSGMAAKVINNAVSHAVMVVLVEAFSLGAASGVAPDLLVELLKRPDAGLIRPLTHRIAERVLNGDYAGGMTLQAARKDSMLALELGQHAGVPLFAIQAAHTVYEIAMHEGLAREDYAVIATLWEAWLDRRLTGPTT
jgi:3-hydroxyisobutyrate dehydrogenase-like beta-hydroxyacid dehydrogenase